MKLFKKMMALVIAGAMVLGAVPAIAQTVGTASAGTGSITIENASKGDTYGVVKLFDATLTNDATASTDASGIAYTGTIPAALESIFEKDEAGNIHVKDGVSDEQVVTAVQAWAANQPPSASAVSNGDELTFQGLPYGYYAVKTTQGATITIDSTRPTATVRDKNSKVPSAEKDVTPSHVSIGDTVTYTATFTAPNYIETPAVGGTAAEYAAYTAYASAEAAAAAGFVPNTDSTNAETDYWIKPAVSAQAAKSEQVVQYVIEDTLPDFLGDVQITSVKVVEVQAKEAEGNPGDPGYVPAVAEQSTDLSSAYTAFTNKKITIPWVTETTIPTANHKYTSKYKNGSQIVITYTAKVTSDADVGAGNVNTVSLKPQVDRGSGPEPYSDEDKWHDDATIYTHAAALQKKANAEDGDNLAGAEFSFKGLVVTGEPGFYTVVSYDKSSSAAAGTVMKCDANGKLVIAGIDADSTTPITLVGTETKAPDGYNKLEGTFNLETIVMSTETTTTHGEKTTYYDPDGNIVSESVTGGSSTTRNDITALDEVPAASIQKVVNKTGTELPSTGGIGTTLFYAVGAVLVLGAAILLVTKRRVA